MTRIAKRSLRDNGPSPARPPSFQLLGLRPEASGSDRLTALALPSGFVSLDRTAR